MRSRGALAFLTALALALASCGDDDDSGSDEAVDTVDAQTAIAQDAEAKANARVLVSLVEVCYVDSQDYSKCTNAAGEEDVGEATVEAPSTTHFVVTSPSDSGNEFSVANTEGGSYARTCTESGTGGCAADGSW